MEQGINYLTSVWANPNKAARNAWWARCLSFAVSWLWCRIASRTEVFSNILPVDISFDSMDMPMMIGTVITLLLILIIGRKIASVLKSKPLLIFTASINIIGSALLVSGNEYTIFPLVLIGVFLSGAAIAFLKLSWGEMFSETDLKDGLITMGTALLAATVGMLVCLLLPLILVKFVFMLCSFACVPLLYYGVHGAKGISVGDAEAATSQPKKTVLKQSWIFFALPILVALTFGVSHGITTMTTGNTFGFEAFVAPVGTGVAGLLLVIVALSGDFRTSPARVYMYAMTLVIIGFMLLVFNFPFVLASYLFIYSGFLTFYYFMIVYWGNLATRMNKPVVAFYALGYFIFYFAQVLGNLISYYLIGMVFPDLLSALSVGIIGAFFVAVLVLYGGARSPVRSWLFSEEATENSDDISNACAILSQQMGLTPREHEVLIFLARGRTASHVVNTLGVSRDTAKTHIKNIYRKLDVHSQQDLMDLVEELAHSDE